jgi:hypothetical protein
LLRHNFTVIRVYFQCTVGAKIGISGISLNTQDFSSIRLPTEGGAYPRRCVKKIVLNASKKRRKRKQSVGFVGFQVLTAVVMKSTMFRNITPCSPLEVNRRFGRTYRLHLQGRRISQARNQRESRWHAFNGLHGVISQKMLLFNLCALLYAIF